MRSAICQEETLAVKDKEVGRALPDGIVLTCSEKRWAMPTLQQRCQLITAGYKLRLRLI